MAIELTTASAQTLNCLRQVLCVPYTDPTNVCYITGGTTLGGCGNQACGCHSLILGGDNNVAAGTNSTILNGNCNAASGPCSMIIGSRGSTASGLMAFIGPGSSNTAAGFNSVILAGQGNVVCGCDSVVMGSTNRITGSYSTAIGIGNTIDGECSFAVGCGNYIANNNIAVLGTSVSAGSAAGVYVDTLFAQNLCYAGSPYHNVKDEINSLNVAVTGLDNLLNFVLANSAAENSVFSTVNANSATWSDTSVEDYYNTISPFITGTGSLLFTNVPTSSAGLTVGQIYSDENGFLRIVLTQ